MLASFDHAQTGWRFVEIEMVDHGREYEQHRAQTDNLQINADAGPGNRNPVIGDQDENRHDGQKDQEPFGLAQTVEPTAKSGHVLTPFILKVRQRNLARLPANVNKNAHIVFRRIRDQKTTAGTRLFFRIFS
jgi:hypothetical protein